MHKSLVIILFFYSFVVNADKKASCLTVSQEDNRLTFFYAKQGKKDKPFFYAKVLKNNIHINKKITWQDVQMLNEHLFPISNTEPRQYLIPDNAKNLYIIKSLGSLNSANGFGISSRIVPDTSPTGSIIKVKMTTKRNAGNYIRTLPKETKKHNSNKMIDAMKICEYELDTPIGTDF